MPKPPRDPRCACAGGVRGRGPQLGSRPEAPAAQLRPHRAYVGALKRAQPPALRV